MDPRDGARWRASTTTPTCSRSPPIASTPDARLEDRRDLARDALRGRAPRAARREDRRRCARAWAHELAAARRSTSVDPEIAPLLRAEARRQALGIELIASENFVSEAVLEAVGSVLTNKYAEGYPGRRYYGGCEVVDEVEQLAIERAKELFGAEHANVQPHSGSQANEAVYRAVLEVGDTILAMNLDHGGHLTHGSPVNFSGKLYKIVPYGVRQDTEQIDYDEVRAARARAPAEADPVRHHRLLARARLRRVPRDRRRGRRGALRRHRAHRGTGRGGRAPDARSARRSIVTTTTHKTLRGPRGGMILCDAALREEDRLRRVPGRAGRAADARDRRQGGGVPRGRAAGVPRLLRADRRQRARARATASPERGFRIVSGGTDIHLFLLSLVDRDITGKAGAGGARARRHHHQQEHGALRSAQADGHVGRAHRHAGGHHARHARAGDGARSRRSIARVLERPGRRGGLDAVRAEVEALCRRFPLYPSRWSDAGLSVRCPFCGRRDQSRDRLAARPRRARRSGAAASATSAAGASRRASASRRCCRAS